MPSPINTGSGNATSGTSVTGTWNSATTAGNFLVAVVIASAFQSSLTAPSGWTSAVQKVNGSTDVAAIFYQWNAASQSSQAFAVPSGGGSVVLAEYAVSILSDPKDVTGSSATFGSSASATASGTTQANELWVFGVGIQGNSPTIGTPSNSFVKEVTKLSTSGNASCCLADFTASATGNATSSVSITSNNWIGLMATFKLPAVVVIQAAPLLFAYGQWPMGPMRSTQRQAIAPKYPHDTANWTGGTPADHATLSSAEYFFGERDPAIAQDTPVVINNYGAWPLGPLRSTQLNGFQWRPHLNSTTITDDGATKNCGASENDLTLGSFIQFYGQVDQLQMFNQILPADSASASDSTAESGSLLASDNGVADSASASDSTTESGSIAFVDAGSAGDSALLGGGPTASDSLSASDSTAESGALALPDSASASDSELSGGGPSVTDTVSASDLWAELGLNNLTDSGQLADLLAWLGLLGFTDSGSLSDSTSFAFALVLPADSASASDSLLLGGADSLLDSASAVDALLFGGSLTSTDSGSLSDFTGFLFSIALPADSASASDSLATGGSNSLLDSTFASDGFGAGGSLGAPDSAQLSDLLAALGLDSTTDSGSISDLFSITSSSTGSIVVTDQLLSLIDALAIVGGLQLQAAVAVSDIETMVSYVVGTGTFKSRDGSGHLVSRDGVAIFKTRDGAANFKTRDGKGNLKSRDGVGSLRSR